HKQSQYEEAMQYYQKAKAMSDELGTYGFSNFVNLQIGGAYLDLGQGSEAKIHLEQVIAQTTASGSKQNLSQAYEYLSDVDSLMGNYQLALADYKMSMLYKDSLSIETNQKEFAQLREKFESEKKDKEIMALNHEKWLLENEKQINALHLKANQDSLGLVQVEKEKIALENVNVKLANEKYRAINLYNQQQIDLLLNEKKLRQLQMEKDSAEYTRQKAEVARNQEQLLLLSSEKELQDFQLNHQRKEKQYLLGGLLLVLLMSAFGYGNYHARQKVKMLTLRNKIASDLHDDVGSTLSSISIYSQMAQAQSSDGISALQKIEESSKRMLEAMADIVWTIKPENDEFEKIIMRMRSFAFELLGAKHIDFEFEADDQVSGAVLSMEARKNLYLIFKEAIHNMVKYADATKAHISLARDKGKLTMVILDNGRGFDPSIPWPGNGLKNMRQRAAEVGGQIRIESAHHNGTRITLELAV
ncbi:MAG TPA: ATP-binding protein, partial [Saprospiraceae bacterium]|nr:ATP-binding protein [Saprospiraceae bacterium]